MYPRRVAVIASAISYSKRFPNIFFFAIKMCVYNLYFRYKNCEIL